MEFQTVANVRTLSNTQQTALKRGKIVTVADLLLATPGDISKRCWITSGEVEKILDVVCSFLANSPQPLSEFEDEDEIFTTGDARLDEALNGGIRTGMVWEVAGESAAGKTQFALQLSLLVQIPREEGGLSGSACYLTTSATLPTSRMKEIIENHPRLSPETAGLSDIHTMKTHEIPTLLQVLARTFPALIAKHAAQPGAKPVKLLVVDALTELFHSHDKVSSDMLSQRAKSLAEISTLLHALASAHRIAVLVLNEVVDVVDRFSDAPLDESHDLIYSEQARWFSRAENIPGEGRKQASLGLVWANQVNTRIMFSRTERTAYLDDVQERRAKRRRLDDSQKSHSIEAQPTRIRRMSVVFSSVAPLMSMDYIVTDEGIVTLPDTVTPNITLQFTVPAGTSRSMPGSRVKTVDGVSLLDVGAIAGDADADGADFDESQEVEDGPRVEDDDEDDYWRALDAQADASGDVYTGAHLPSSAPS